LNSNKCEQQLFSRRSEFELRLATLNQKLDIIQERHWKESNWKEKENRERERKKMRERKKKKEEVERLFKRQNTECKAA
jgi:hypothetical protein